MPDEASKKGWTPVAFGDVVIQVRDRVDPDTSGLDRYVAGEHMDTDDLRIRRFGLIGDGYLGPAFHMRFKPGHVLYGSRRTYLRKVAVAEFEGITANTTFVIGSKDPRVLLPELLPFIMQTESFHEHSIKQSKGSVNPYVNFSDVTGFRFGLPPLDEQQRIVTVLRSAQMLRESLLGVLDRIAIVREAFVASLYAAPEVEQIRLGSLLGAITPGKSLSGAESAPNADEFGVLKVSAVDPQGFQPQESKRLLHKEEFLSRFSVRAGDLLITRANTPELVGEVCLVDRDYPNLMLSDKTLRLEVAPDIDAYLLSATLQSDIVRRQLTAVATGTGRAMKNISQDEIRDLTVAYPRRADVADASKATFVRLSEAARLARERFDAAVALMRSLSETLLSVS